MNKKEFLGALYAGLQGYPEADIQQHLDFYSEMIEDRIEEGLSEEEAVAHIGTPAEAVEKIKEETPLPCTNKKEFKLEAWHIVLIILGFPVWGSLLISAIAVIFSFIVSIYAIPVTLAACGIAGILSIIPMSIQGNIPAGIMLVGLGLICTGLSILCFSVITSLTKWLVSLIKKFIAWIKSYTKSRKEGVK